MPLSNVHNAKSIALPHPNAAVLIQAVNIYDTTSHEDLISPSFISVQTHIGVPNPALLILGDALPLLPRPLQILMPYGRQCDNNAQATRRERDKVCVPVAVQAVRAGPLAVRADDAVAIKDGAVEQIEDVARDHGAEGHEAPVLAQAVDAKRLGHDGGEDAKEEAVAEARQARHEAQQVRVRDAQRAELGDAEDEPGHDEAPGAVGVQDLDEEVGSDTC